MSFVKGFVWNHLAKLTDYGLTYLISVILARNLDSISYSLYVSVYNIGTILIIVSSLGIDETINKFVSQLSVNKKKGQINYLLHVLLKYRVAAVLFLSFVVFIFREKISILFNAEEISFYITIILFFVLFQNLSNFLAHYFTALLNTKLIFILNTTIKLLSLSFISFYLSFDHNLTIILTIISTASLLSFLTYIYFARDLFLKKREFFNTREVNNFFPVMWLNAIFSIILGRYSDILLLGILLGVTNEVGNYEVAFSLSTAIDYVFSVGLVGVIISVFSMVASSDKSKIVPIRNKIIKYYQFIVFPIMLFSLIFAHDLITLIYSEKFLNAIVLFQVILFFKILIVNIFGSGLNISILVSINKQKYVLINRLVLGSLNIILNIIFIPQYGALGAIAITGFILFLIYLIDFILVSKLISFNYDFKFLLKNFIIVTSWLAIISIINLYLDIMIIPLFLIFLVGLSIIYFFLNRSMIVEITEELNMFFRRN